MALFSFLKRKKQDFPELSSDVDISGVDKNSPYDLSKPKTKTQSAQRSPYPVQTMSDGRTRYSDGSVRGNVTKPQRTQSRTTQQYNQPIGPQQQPQQPQQQPSVPSYLQNYLQGREQRAGQRVAGVQQRAQEAQDIQRQLAEKRMGTLQNIGDIQSQSFNQYADQVRKGLGIQKGTTQRQIGTTQDIYDEQRYQNERSRQERMKGLESTLASLGTLQSSALGNVGAKINMGAERQDRTAQREMRNRIADLQDQYRLAENQAEGLIQQEAAKFRQQAELLSNSMDTNSLEYRQAINNIAANADQQINNILGSLDEFGFNLGMKMAEMQANKEDQLSDQFLSTGQPMTRADMIWAAENPDKLESLQGMTSQGQPSESSQKALSIIRDLKTLPTKGITGRLRLGFSNDARRAQGLLSQLVSELQLEEAKRMKGQGTMTDAERAILRDAIAAFNLDENNRSRLSDEDFLAELDRLEQELSGVSGTSDYSALNEELVSQFGG